MQPYDPNAQNMQYQQPMQYAQPQQMIVVSQGGGGAGLAITSMIMGITGFVFTFIPYASCLTPVLVLLGIIFGHIGLSKSKTTGIGRGQAIAGLVLSYLTLLVWAFVFVFLLYVFQSNDVYSMSGI